MQKKHKIFGVVVTLVLLMVIVNFASIVYAEEAASSEETTMTVIDCSHGSLRYGLYIMKGSGENNYIVQKDPLIEQTYATVCTNEPTDTDKYIMEALANENYQLELTHINDVGVSETDRKKITKDNSSISITATLQNSPTSSFEKYIKATFNVTPVSESLGESGRITLEVWYNEEVFEEKNHEIQYEYNAHYNGRCAEIRNSLSGDKYTFYEKNLPYCWKAQVLKGTNYSLEDLETKISRVEASWVAFTAPTGAGDVISKIADIKSKASDITTDGDDIASKAPFELKCAPFNIDRNTADVSYPYLNEGNYWATDTDEFLDLVYTYRLAPGKTKTETQSNVCTRTCEEGVKVEYGPPVASKAGLCFEYQVKITSYVNCTSEFEAEPPEEKTHCSPKPQCYWHGWLAYIQGGPNEDFESCINKCDGGEYTQKCSVKCYNKVYAKTSNSKIKLALNYENSSAEKIFNPAGSELDSCYAGSDGYYYYDSNDNIQYKRLLTSFDECEIDYAGRWYKEVNYTSKYYPLCTSVKSGTREYQVYEEDSFVRAYYYGTGEHCSDNCAWEGCSGKYLNPEPINEDYLLNENAYEAARAECAAATKCSTKTATFTISVDYTTKDGDNPAVNEKVEFPYSPTSRADSPYPDQLPSLGEDQDDANTASNKNTTIISYNGCYTSADEKKWYLSEWSFPGTYIHNKTGEISYNEPSDTSGWYYESRKLCLPLNVQPVNSKWWTWKVVDEGDTAIDTIGYTTSDGDTKAQIEADIKYNIEANARNFGYYGWNFDIKCFFGTPDEPAKYDYIIRPIDLDNMFPNEVSPGVVDATKREIGFNWTSSATITSLKNPAYQVNPPLLIQEIENTANTLYGDDSELDYQFYLTPSTLREIRKYNDKYDYAVWNGKVEQVSGINVYLSNLWNSVPGHIESNINLRNIDNTVKATGTPGLNNE